MADTTGHVKITDEQLAKSAIRYRKELLMMPVLALGTTLKHMNKRPGVRGKEVVGELSGDIELGPYDEGRVDTDGVSINPRTLETFLGSVVKKFSPNSVWQTVYGNLISKGESLKNVDISLQVLSFLTAKLGASLNASIWSAKRNDAGTKTKELFNGFDTITKTEGEEEQPCGAWDLSSATRTGRGAGRFCQSISRKSKGWTTSISRRGMVWLWGTRTRTIWSRAPMWSPGRRPWGAIASVT